MTRATAVEQAYWFKVGSVGISAIPFDLWCEPLY